MTPDKPVIMRTSPEQFVPDFVTRLCPAVPFGSVLFRLTGTGGWAKAAEI